MASIFEGKMAYEAPMVDVIQFTVTDVITSSVSSEGGAEADGNWW